MDAPLSQPVVPVPQKKSSIIKWALIIGITIVVNLFITYLVDVIYPMPEFTDFCPESQVNRAIETETACLEIGGQWNENIEAKSIPPQVTVPVPAGYCDATYTCGKQYEEVMKVYNRNVFVVFIIAGILLLVGSMYLKGVEAISLGLSFGGILSLIIGSVRYWSDMDDILRVILLGIALAGLIFVAYKKFKD